jgi:hypothetical protein
MLDTLITSKTRIKLLLKFFLNSSSISYLRGLESEFGESSNAIRLELNRFEKAGLLTSFMKGNKKMFHADTSHPLFREIHNLLLKHIGFDQIIDNVTSRLGDVKIVYLIGDFAKGKDSKIIDLLFVGDDIDKEYLIRKVSQVEKLISRKIRFLVYKDVDYKNILSDYKDSEILLLWKDERRNGETKSLSD